MGTTHFEVIPAIDLLGGKCVRLHQGKFEASQVYFENPLDALRKWEREGAQRIHVVDLEGAKSGQPIHQKIIQSLLASTTTKIQVGGGVRNLETMEEYIRRGADRVVLGTAALEDFDFLKQACQKFKSRVVLAIDMRSGTISISGWTGSSPVRLEDAIERAMAAGVPRFIFTSIERDGTLEGPNFLALEHFLSLTKRPVIASGGVSSLQDILKLRGLSHLGVEGCIVGKALYEGTIQYADAERSLSA